MKLARIRLVFFVLLFTGWLGYLGYLALVRKPPVVISRSQLTCATHTVEAEVEFKDGKPISAVKIKAEFGTGSVPLVKTDDTIEIDNLNQTRLSNGRPLTPGTYLIPLVEDPVKKTSYYVASPAPSLGYEGSEPPLVYKWSDEVEREIRKLVH